MLFDFLKSVETFANAATTSTSVTISVAGIELTVIPISTGIACGITVSKKVIYEVFLQKCKKQKKQRQSPKTNNFFIKKIWKY